MCSLNTPKRFEKLKGESGAETYLRNNGRLMLAFIVFEIQTREYVVFEKQPLYEQNAMDFFEFRYSSSSGAQVAQSAKSYHEVIFGDCRQKIKFDVDISVKDIVLYEKMRDMGYELIDNLINAIHSYFEDCGISLMQRDIILCSSCYDEDVSSLSDDAKKGGLLEKVSFHVVVDKSVNSNIEAKRICEAIIQRIPQEFRQFIDAGVNKRIQNLRILGERPFKEGKMSPRVKRVVFPRSLAQMPRAEQFIMTLIRSYAPLISDYLPAAITGSMLDGYLNELKESSENGELAAIIEKAAREAIPEIMQAHILRSKGGFINGMEIFDRIAPSRCDICERVHDVDNTFILFANINYRRGHTRDNCLGGNSQQNSIIDSSYITVTRACRRDPVRKVWVCNIFNTSLNQSSISLQQSLSQLSRNHTYHSCSQRDWFGVLRARIEAPLQSPSPLQTRDSPDETAKASQSSREALEPAASSAEPRALRGSSAEPRALRASSLIPEVSAILRDFPGIKLVEYSQSTMKAFTDATTELPNWRTLLVRAPMKIGKTKALKEFVSALPSYEAASASREPSASQKILLVSFRRTFSATSKAAFPDFTLYSDIPTELPLALDKMIVQVESLHRISPKDLEFVDMVILDEAESIIEQFAAGLSSKPAISFAVFEWLLRNAKHIIAMDAFLSERTVGVIQRIRGIANANLPDTILINNAFQNATEDTHYFTDDRGVWLHRLNAALAAGERVVIPTNNASFARKVETYLGTYFPDKKILLYSAETSQSRRKEHFSDVAKYWDTCDVLIYTPTLTAGVSFEKVKHFSQIFTYFTDNSCTAQTCIQMMGRIRSVAKHSFVHCIAESGGSLPETPADLSAWISMRAEALTRDLDGCHLLDIEFQPNGIPFIKDTNFSTLWMYNQCITNKSRNAFSQVLISLIRSTGASVRYICNKEVPGAEYEKVLSEFEGAANATDEKRAKQISAAAELTAQEYNSLQQKSSEINSEITEDELHEMRKHELRIIFDWWQSDISPEFAKVYSLPQNQTVYQNLKEYDTAQKEKGSASPFAVLRTAEARRYTAIREEHGECGMKTLQFRHSYELHRVIGGLLANCGFIGGVLDFHFYTAREIEKAISSNCQRIQRGIHSAVCVIPHLEAAEGAKSGETDSVLKFVAKASEAVYGIGIVKMPDAYRLCPLGPFDYIGGKIVLTEARQSLNPH
ncbi:MAG: hypothetical protein M0R33_14105 [Methylomonas sp.]|jgi:hypothetical protein|uniref:hypothetical protein n=1 Tax=Methylomonas sp. TaxID=418 RepID=UPI0025D37377|nr:hypothetical protein [Methylomonas sp.]MCK9607570.1 hypothetical protein [Methylomonas sp.]